MPAMPRELDLDYTRRIIADDRFLRALLIEIEKKGVELEGFRIVMDACSRRDGLQIHCGVVTPPQSAHQAENNAVLTRIIVI
jgi:hypothetical protein